MIMPWLITNTYVSLMYELKKMKRYLRVNLLGPDSRLMKKEFTGPRSHKGWETLLYGIKTLLMTETEQVSKMFVSNQIAMLFIFPEAFSVFLTFSVFLIIGAG
jgi:hypothetical protein